MKSITILIFFLFLGAFFILSNENIKLDSKENVDAFLTVYSKWIDKLIDNEKTVASYVIKMEWLPDSG